MQKLALVLILTAVVLLPACGSFKDGGVIGMADKGLWSGVKWVDYTLMGQYPDSGHYNNNARWRNWQKNWSSIWNVIDIYLFNYDVRDPYVDAPFFGDPR